MKFFNGLFAAAAFFTTLVTGFGWVFGILLPALFGEPPIPGAMQGAAVWTPATIVCWIIYRSLENALKKEAESSQKRPSPASATSAPLGSSVPNTEQLLPIHWARDLSRYGVDLDELERKVEAIYLGGDVLPDRANVFRAFRLTKLADVRVVILGQDPYPEPGLAHGLAFSVPKGAPVPASLAAMFRAITSDPELGLALPANGSLTRWATQGVLLLNSALTVTEHSPGSHLDDWRDFTLSVLRTLNAQPEPIVFLLFGDPAVLLASDASLSAPHKVIEMAHPAAWAKTKLPKVSEELPFSKANAFLVRNARGYITW